MKDSINKNEDGITGSVKRFKAKVDQQYLKASKYIARVAEKSESENSGDYKFLRFIKEIVIKVVNVAKNSADRLVVFIQ